MEETLHRHFASLGLNPLAMLRTDVEPGTLIVVGTDGVPRLLESIRTYLPEAKRTALLPENRCGSPEGCPGVLPGYQHEQSLSLSAAVSLLQGLVTWNPSAELGYRGSVKVDQIFSRYAKISPKAVNDLLGRNDRRAAAEFVLETLSAGEGVFVAYEVHESDSVKISSAEGTDIAPKLELRGPGPLAGAGQTGAGQTGAGAGSLEIDGSAQMRYRKVSKTELLVAADRPYVFAVKTGELVKNEAGDTVRLKITQPIAAGQDVTAAPGAVSGDPDPDHDPYAASIGDNFAPLTFAP